MPVADLEVEKMQGGRGKPKEVRTVTIDNKSYRVLPEQPAQNWQIDRFLLNETIGMPDPEKDETLVAVHDEVTNTLIVRKARIKYQVEVSFVK